MCLPTCVCRLKYKYIVNKVISWHVVCNHLVYAKNVMSGNWFGGDGPSHNDSSNGLGIHPTYELFMEIYVISHSNYAMWFKTTDCHPNFDHFGGQANWPAKHQRTSASLRRKRPWTIEKKKHDFWWLFSPFKNHFNPLRTIFKHHLIYLNFKLFIFGENNRIKWCLNIQLGQQSTPKLDSPSCSHDHQYFDDPQETALHSESMKMRTGQALNGNMSDMYKYICTVLYILIFIFINLISYLYLYLYLLKYLYIPGTYSYI